MKSNKKNFFSIDYINGVYTLRSTSEFTFHIWRNSATEFHKHENYIEIFIILKGKIAHRMLGETTILQPGDIGLILPGIPHIHYSINNETVQILNITCNSTTAEMIFSNIYHHSFPTTSINRLQPKELKIVKSFRDMIFSAPSESYYNTLIASFCIYLLGLFPTLNSAQDKIPEPFQKFINSLQEMDLGFVKISDLYKQSGYSQRTLSNYFQKYTNQTLVQYVNAIKLNHAKNLLRSTDLPVTEICSKVGFNSISHFNHLFKSSFGISPKDYRNMPSP